jgi:methylenetetrahydrofolate dehydrogenase (NADP+)/methenyltetrahydrofolate cyclohydrolase
MKGKINGEKIADRIENELETDETPELEIILVGDSEASRTFVQKKLEAASRLGFRAELKEFSSSVEQSELLTYIRELNSDPEVDGVLIQLPLPDNIDEDAVFRTLDPGKDIDCLTSENLGRLLRGEPYVRPAAVEAVHEILKEYNVELKGGEVTIINNSNLIGRPLSMLMTQGGATVTICDRNTEDLEKHTSEADVLVTATGESGVVDADMVAEDSVVIDAGYGPEGGDIEQVDEISEKALLAPVPHGLGPVTVAVTMRNLLKLHRK